MPTETVVLDLPVRPGKPVFGQGGTEVVLSPSVYDVPQSATIEWNGSERVVRVTFGYVDNETANERRINDLTLYTGKNSEKVIALSLKVGGANQKVADELAQGIDRQIAHATRDNQRLNYAIVRDVLLQILAPLITKAVRLAPTG
jgi:hypothetical protein